MDALRACLEFSPSAVELMDHMLIDLARATWPSRTNMAAIQRSTGGAAHGRIQQRRRRPRSADRARPPATSPATASGCRGAGAGSRSGRARSAVEPAPGRDAAAVRHARRSQAGDIRRGHRRGAGSGCRSSSARFREILHQHGTDGAFYGHASVGCLHIRPVLNLKDPPTWRGCGGSPRTSPIWCWSSAAALSGEHGDGLARSEWNQQDVRRRRLRGLSPGQARLRPAQPAQSRQGRRCPADDRKPALSARLSPRRAGTIFDYRQQEGFLRSIELCNGIGRLPQDSRAATMCPSFRATLDEKDSTRGRANACGLALMPARRAVNRSAASARAMGPRGARSVPDVQGVQVGVSQQRRHGQAEGGVSAVLLRGQARPLGHVLMARIAPAQPLRIAWRRRW